jgi:hypothetical protein
LLQVFYQFSFTLEINIQIAFQQWINSTQIQIVQNSTLTEYEILVEIWYSLQVFFVQYPQVEVAIQFLYIGDWGYFCDLEGTVIEIQSTTTVVSTQQIITIGGGGSCPLTAALNQCAQSASPGDQAAIQVLIQNITATIELGYSFEYTLTLIYQSFSGFFIQYPQLISVIYSGQIQGFGVIQAYIDICQVYWQIQNFAVAVGGDSCALIQSLYALYTNQSYSLSQRQDFKELHDKLVVYFSANIAVEVRVQYFAEQLYQLLILAEWDISILYVVEINGYGSLYDLIYAYIYCTNHGVHPVTPGTPKPVTTPAINTTAAATTTPVVTTVPTTAAPTTTAFVTGNCATVTSVNTYNVALDTTVLLQAINADQATWTQIQINQFAAAKINILQYSKDTTLTAVQIFNKIKAVIQGVANSAVRAKVQAVLIVSWGTVAQYCSCSL